MLAERTPLYARADAAIDTAGRTETQSLRDLVKLLPSAPAGAARRSAGRATRGRLPAARDAL
jgi:hypothetical protein